MWYVYFYKLTANKRLVWLHTSTLQRTNDTIFITAVIFNIIFLKAMHLWLMLMKQFFFNLAMSSLFPAVRKQSCCTAILSPNSILKSKLPLNLVTLVSSERGTYNMLVSMLLNAYRWSQYNPHDLCRARSSPHCQKGSSVSFREVNPWTR